MFSDNALPANQSKQKDIMSSTVFFAVVVFFGGLAFLDAQEFDG